MKIISKDQEEIHVLFGPLILLVQILTANNHENHKLKQQEQTCENI